MGHSELVGLDPVMGVLVREFLISHGEHVEESSGAIPYLDSEISSLRSSKTTLLH